MSAEDIIKNFLYYTFFEMFFQNIPKFSIYYIFYKYSKLTTKFSLSVPRNFSKFSKNLLKFFI